MESRIPKFEIKAQNIERCTLDVGVKYLNIIIMYFLCGINIFGCAREFNPKNTKVLEGYYYIERAFEVLESGDTALILTDTSMKMQIEEDYKFNYDALSGGYVNKYEKKYGKIENIEIIEKYSGKCTFKYDVFPYKLPGKFTINDTGVKFELSHLIDSGAEMNSRFVLILKNVKQK